jgi:hypothetical protein
MGVIYFSHRQTVDSHSLYPHTHPYRHRHPQKVVKARGQALATKLASFCDAMSAHRPEAPRSAHVDVLSALDFTSAAGSPSASPPWRLGPGGGVCERAAMLGAGRPGGGVCVEGGGGRLAGVAARAYLSRARFFA